MTKHNTHYAVWSECDQHQEPDSSEDPRYDCAGKSHCQSFPLVTDWGTQWIDLAGNDPFGYVLCQGCTTFQAEQEEWECTHDSGETLDGDWVTLCKAIPPRHYCLECSEDEGDWVKHQDPEADQ